MVNLVLKSFSVNLFRPMILHNFDITLIRKDSFDNMYEKAHQSLPTGKKGRCAFILQLSNSVQYILVRWAKYAIYSMHCSHGSSYGYDLPQRPGLTDGSFPDDSFPEAVFLCIGSFLARLKSGSARIIIRST